MSGTILVKSPVIPQWWNITVTAPSVTNIPSGFYDGTETITANGWLSISSIYIIDDNIRTTSSNWSITSTRYDAIATLDTTQYIYSFIEFDNWAWNKFIIIDRLYKLLNAAISIWETSYTSSDILQSVYENLWIVSFNFNTSPSPIYHLEYNISSNTWNWLSWHNISGTLLNNSVVYQWYNCRWFSIIQPTWWLSNSRYLTWFNLY